MKYYQLTSSEENIMPAVINWYEKINPKYITRELYGKLSPYIMLDMESALGQVYTDIITEPFFLVSKEVRKLISIYDKTIPFKFVALFDVKKGKNKIYYLPILEKINGISNESQFNLDKSKIKKLVLDLSRIGDVPLFLLDGVSTSSIIIRMDLAESILERDAIGIQLQEVQTIPKESIFEGGNVYG